MQINTFLTVWEDKKRVKIAIETDRGDMGQYLASRKDTFTLQIKITVNEITVSYMF